MKGQFNDNTEKWLRISQVMTSMKWLRMSMLSLVSRKGMARILKKMTCGRSNRFFRSYCIGKNLDVCHSIDVMHVEKNVCESLLGTLLNTNGETRDNELA
jgi:hypothetical protein